ncbi:MAG: hypothetical protein IRY95_04195 [Clostridia bacterium]|nr:hypothetical protein [Clostridia bacterium]
MSRELDRALYYHAVAFRHLLRCAADLERLYPADPLLARVGDLSGRARTFQQDLMEVKREMERRAV